MVKKTDKLSKDPWPRVGSPGPKITLGAVRTRGNIWKGLESKGFRGEILKDTFNHFIIQQTFVKYLLCTEHCCRFWEIKY